MSNIERNSKHHGVDKLIFYFSGHGVSIKGRNYLALPNARLRKKKKRRRGFLKLDNEVIPWMRRVKASPSMAFLDQRVFFERQSSVVYSEEACLV